MLYEVITVQLIETYAKEQGLWRYDGQPDALYSDTLELDLGDVEPSIAGPKRPQDRITSYNVCYTKLLRLRPAQREMLTGSIDCPLPRPSVFPPPGS